MSASGNPELSEEAKRAVVSLYQTCPGLWAEFKIIIDCLDRLDTTSYVSSEVLHACVQHLSRAEVRLRASDTGIKDLGQFAAVTGFVDRSVDTYRQILRHLGQTYVASFSILSDTSDFYRDRIRSLRSFYLNFCLESEDVSLRLVQGGFLQDVLGDLNHIAQISAGDLETQSVYRLSAGIIHNWCRHPRVLPLVKQRKTEVISTLSPFLYTTDEQQDVPSIALMVVSLVMDDTDPVDLLRLQPITLQHLLDSVRGALDRQRYCHNGWSAAAILEGWARLSRCDFNRRLLVAQGTMKVLKRILKATDRLRLAEEQRAAVDVLVRLLEDPHISHVLRSDCELKQVLNAIPDTASPEAVKAAVNSLLHKIGKPCSDGPEAEDVSTSGHVADLLAGELNMLAISGMGEVEFVMDLLTQAAGAGGRRNSSGDVSRLKVLQALTELACKDDGCRWEMMARGALDELTKVLEDGEKDEKAEAARVLLELTRCEENREIIKARSDLVICLSEATVSRDNEDLAQTAAAILQALTT